MISIGLGGTALADDYPNHAGTNGIIYPGQSVYGTLENGSDQDWFAIDLQAGMSVTLDLEGQRTNRGSLGDPLLAVYDVNNREIGRNDDGGEGFNSRLTLTAPYTGRFFVSAQSFGSSTGTYTLTASGVGGGAPVAYDDYPATPGTSGRVMVPGQITGNLENGNDEDWFAVQLNAGQTITISLEGQPTNAGSLSDPLLGVYDGYGNQIDRNDDGGQGFNSLLTFTAPQSGTYFLGAGSFGNNAGTYMMRVTGQQPVVQDDFPSNPQTNGRLNVPGQTGGNLETGDDQDWFAVQLQPGAPVIFDLEGQRTNRGTLGDPYLRIFDQYGTELDRNDDGGEGFNSRLQFVAPQYGTYFVSAGSFGASTGTYTLTASGGAPPPPQDDYPSTPQTNGRLNVPGQTTGNLETGDDQDWFAVQLQPGAPVTFDLEGQRTNRGSLGDPYLRIFDQFGTELDRNDDGGEGFNSRLQFVAPQYGTYFVSAGSFGGSTGTYTLTASGGAPPPPQDDYPNTPQTHGRVNVPGSITGNLETGDDQDWFAVQLQPGMQVTIDLEGQPTNRGSLSDPLLRVYDQYGSEVAANDDGGDGFNSRLQFVAPGPGTYFLGAGSFGNNAGTYTLTVTGSAPPPPQDDYPATPQTTGRVNAPGATNGNLETGDDEDWFAVQLQAGAAYTIDLEGERTNRGSLGDPLLVVYDSFGNEIGRNDDGGEGFNSRLDLTVPSSGTYFLGARSFGSSSGTYTLTVTGGAPPAPQDDYPATPQTTGRVNAPGSTTGNLETGDDEDWFAVQLQAGAAYTIDLEGERTNRGSLGDPLLVVYDSFGSEIGRNDDGGEGFNSRLDLTVPSSGTYFIGARSFGASTGTYTLTVAGGAPPAPQDDFADNPGTTGQAFPGNPTTGNLESGDDHDWFRADLQAGITYTIDLEGQPTNRGSLGDPLLTLFDGSGNQVGRNDDGGEGFNSRLTFTPTTSGTYFIDAGSFGSSAGTYTLTVSPAQTGQLQPVQPVQPTQPIVAETPALPQPGGDDFGNAPGATGQISVGSSAIGNLETDGDVDWFAVTLDGGTAYTVDVEGRRTGGGSLGDPLVRIFDTVGAEVAMDDDSGEGLNPRATFTTGAGGTYYIGVEAFGSGTGDYTVRISR
ncbi:MAG: PPC domain-containing protein [Rhodospirillaceae bacterium]|nr:PPC domain-containing protein [Rhodospirillaceae bacterium]